MKIRGRAYIIIESKTLYTKDLKRLLDGSLTLKGLSNQHIFKVLYPSEQIKSFEETCFNDS